MTKQLSVQRFSVVSSKPFEEVLQGLEKGMGRPDMRVLHGQMTATSSFREYEKVIHAAVGSADLMEFLRLDLGAPMGKDPNAKSFKIVRIIAGNPLIMKQMVESVPDAGSYAPVKILVYESKDGVRLSYDTMVSYLASYDKSAVLEVARSLDEKVTRLLTEAAG